MQNQPQPLNIFVYSDYTKISHSVVPEVTVFLKLAEFGHQITVFTPAIEDMAFWQKHNISAIETGQTKKLCRRTIRLLRQKIQELKPDILFATNSKSIPSSAFASRGQNVKLVGYRGTTRGLKRRDPTSFLSLLHPRIDAIVCVSKAVEDAVSKKLLWQRQTTAIYKGHDLAWYNAAPIPRQTLGIPDDAFVAIAVARFRPSKGLDILLRACQRLAHHHNFYLLVVGSGADTDEYQNLAKASGMEERIIFTGQKPDAPAYTATANVLIQASIDGEGLPRTIVEAMAYGIPSIATSVGGAKELIEDGKHGYIIPPKDVDTLASTIEHCLLNSDKCVQMADACKDLLKNELSINNTARQYATFFNSLCS